MARAAKKPVAKKNRGLVTSLHVTHPAMFKRIQRAAKKLDVSTSKFLLAAGDKEATRVLDGNCPSCGAVIKKTKKAA
jgi:hypothetical protein